MPIGAFLRGFAESAKVIWIRSRWVFFGVGWRKRLKVLVWIADNGAVLGRGGLIFCGAVLIFSQNIASAAVLFLYYKV